MNAPEPGRLLQGKSALVTAAAGTGIGSATAARFAQEGVRAITVSDMHARRLAETAEAIRRDAGIEVIECLCDVTDESQVQALVDRAAAAMDGIDVLFNNAGLGGSAPLVDMRDADWHAVLDVTLTGTFRMTRAALRHMRSRGGGAIVNNASVLGWRAQREQAHYAAAKAGVMALTRCAALEAAEFGVRVNAVAPSLVMHPFLSRVTSEEVLAELVSKEAFGRSAEPWEVATVVVFLASDYAAYMTGEVVPVSSQHP